MNKPTINQGFRVIFHGGPDPSAPITINYSPKRIMSVGIPGYPSEQMELIEYSLTIQGRGEAMTFAWAQSPQAQPIEQYGFTRQEFETDARCRIAVWDIWYPRVTSLVKQVEQWAGELDWSTRKIDKNLADEEIGKHIVPALVMQHETDRALLEPVARTVPGADGLVDLYLMPAYDDIAHLYFEGDGWQLESVLPLPTTGAKVKQTEVKPFSAEALAAVLAQMKHHGG